MPKGIPKSGTNKGWFKEGQGFWTGKKRDMPWLPLYKKGHKPWNKDLRYPRFPRPSGLEYEYLKGNKHPNWQGDNVGYPGVHAWMAKTFGKADHCSFNPNHKSTRFHWANVSGSYLRDPDDWTQLCPSCHKQYDKLLHHPISNTFKNVGKRIFKDGENT